MLRMTNFQRDAECSATITVQFYFVVEQGLAKTSNTFFLQICQSQKIQENQAL